MAILTTGPTMPKGTPRRRVPSEQSERNERRYWEAYLRFGFLVFLLESAVALGYAATTRAIPHRDPLLGITAVGLAFPAAALFGVERLAASPHRRGLVTAVNAGSSLLLTVACACDGGLDSPLLYLLVLPMMAAALALPPRAVALLGALAAAEVGLVAEMDANVTLSAGKLVLLLALLAGTLLLSVGSSFGRDRLQREETDLVDQLEELARTDSLTGCSNHRAFYEQLSAELTRAERHHEPLALLVADVDLFKSFNDRHGHDRGDEQLAAVGVALRNASRAHDLVARIGGDEFALILPHTELAQAIQFATRLAAALHRDPRVAVTLSFGVAEMTPAEPTTTRLFRDADSALYEAKTRGRDRVQSTGHALADDAGHAASHEDRDRLRDELLAIRHELAASAAVAQALQDAAPTALGFMDRELRLLQVNPALAGIAGMAVEDLRGRRLDEAFPAEWELLAPLVRRVVDQRRSENFVAVVPPTGAGDERTWHAYLFPVEDDGAVIGVGTVMVDVTDALRATEAQRTTTEHVVAALAAASEMRDPYTSGHQDRVGELAVAIARELGLDEAHVQDIGLAARIHDIGKVGVPSEILTKPGRLSEPELALVRTHAELGAQLLHQVHFPDRVAEIVRHHHERLDGSGYPDRLRGDEISIGARIVAVADVAEAVASRRPYRAAQGVHAAMQVLADESATRLDPVIVATFVRLLNEGRIDLREEGDASSAHRRAVAPGAPASLPVVLGGRTHGA